MHLMAEGNLSAFPYAYDAFTKKTIIKFGRFTV